MAEQYLVSSSDLTSVADAIRAKTGGTDQLSFPEGFKTAIAGITTENATDRYVEYTYDDNGVSAVFHGFTTIPAGICKGKTELTSVDFKDSPNLTSIGANAFDGCTNLTLTSLPDGITSIGASAFSGCTNLALTSLPSSLTSIDECTFDGCTNLALTSLPDGITSIGTHAFRKCTNLVLTSLPDGITSIGYASFYMCESLAFTSLPGSLISIGTEAFGSCTNLALTSLPDGITSIGERAFYRCTNLALTSLPSSLISIGELAFFCCKNLTNIEIAARALDTKQDNGGMFRYCDKLQKVWLRSTCTSISASSAVRAPFAYCPDSLEIYAEPTEKPDGWGEYFNGTGDEGSVTATVVYGQTTCPW